MLIEISICRYNNGTFDVIISDPASDDEVTFSGTQDFTEEEADFCERVAPACIWTQYLKHTTTYRHQEDD